MPRSTAPLTDEVREARNAKARAAYANKKARDAEVKAAADAWRAEFGEATCQAEAAKADLDETFRQVEPESDVLVPEPVEVIPALPPGPVAPVPEHDEEAAEKMREHLVALGNGHAFRSPAVAGRTSVELANLHDVDHALAASSTALCSDRMDRVHAASAEWGAMQAWLKDGAFGPRPESSNRIVLHAEKIHGTEQPVRAIVSAPRSRRAASPRPEKATATPGSASGRRRYFPIPAEAVKAAEEAVKDEKGCKATATLSAVSAPEAVAFLAASLEARPGSTTSGLWKVAEAAGVNLQRNLRNSLLERFFAGSPAVEVAASE